MTEPRALPGGYPRTGAPLARDGVPPWDRTAEGVLATRRAVSLLRSRRRTFLFCAMITFKDIVGLGVLLRLRYCDIGFILYGTSCLQSMIIRVIYSSCKN